MFSKIKGKWSGKTFHLHKQIGQGANGTVYLAEYKGIPVALKKGSSTVQMQMEVNRIQQLSKAQDSPLESYFILTDDEEANGATNPFYVMRFVDGPTLDEPGKRYSSAAIYKIGKQMLEWLCFFHKQGYAFGDLKPENVILTKDGRIHVIDYGGVTPFGNAIKEYTTLFDRAAWGAGTRVADRQYDLFAFVMVTIVLAFGGVPKVREHRVHRLCDIIHKNPSLAPWRTLLKDLLRGQVETAEMALARWRDAYIKHHSTAFAGDYGDRSGKMISWIPRMFGASLLLCVVSLWVAWGG